MVCGDIPFETNDQIKNANLHFKESICLSESLKSLIRCCLVVSVQDRITLAGIKEHPWMRSGEKIKLERTKSSPMNMAGKQQTISNEKAADQYCIANDPTKVFTSDEETERSFYSSEVGQMTKLDSSSVEPISPTCLPMSISPSVTSFNETTNYSQFVPRFQSSESSFWPQSADNFFI